jgi:hypothetical protein
MGSPLIIDGNLFAGTNAEPVANLHLIEWNVGFAALVVKPLGRLRSQAKQRANRTAGLAASAQLQHLTEKNQSDDNCCRLEVHIDLPRSSAKRSWKYLRNYSGEDAIEIGRASAKGNQREHVEAAMHNRLPASDKERQSAPQNHRSCESKLDPCPHSRREQVLHRHGRQKYGDHESEHRHGESDADPQPPCHIGQLWVGVFGGYLPRFECHAADGTRAWCISHDLRVHRAGVFGTFCEWVHGGRFERHAALWTATRTRLLNLWMHGAGICEI